MGQCANFHHMFLPDWKLCVSFLCQGWEDYVRINFGKAGSLKNANCRNNHLKTETCPILYDSIADEFLVSGAENALFAHHHWKLGFGAENSLLAHHHWKLAYKFRVCRDVRKYVESRNYKMSSFCNWIGIFSPSLRVSNCFEK